MPGAPDLLSRVVKAPTDPERRVILVVTAMWS